MKWFVFSERRWVMSQASLEIYKPWARFFHWLIVVLLLVQLPVGLYMVYRRTEVTWIDEDGYVHTGLFDALTGTLYNSHKLLGVILLLIILARLLYRLTAGAPAAEPTLAAWQKGFASLTHWALYGLLVAVPVLGYLASAYFDSLTLFEVIPLPALVGEDRALGKFMIEWHSIAAYVLIGLVTLHVLVAFYHHFVRGDNVLARMLPGLQRNKQ